MEITQSELLDMIFHEFEDYYLDVCNKRILFYNNMEGGCLREAADSAYDFLDTLHRFREQVPKSIIRERFENFKETNSLAKFILKDLGLVYQKN